MSSHAFAENSVSLEELTLAQESGLTAEQIQNMSRVAGKGSGCANTPDWMTAGNTPNWMTAGNTPDWMTAGNTPDWMNAGNTPNWYNNGNVMLRQGAGEIPNPRVQIEELTLANEQGLTLAEIQKIVGTSKGNGCGNRPDWMTSGNRPDWMTAGNRPDWMTAGNRPDWMTAGSRPSWHTGSRMEGREGEGEIPSPQVNMQ